MLSIIYLSSFYSSLKRSSSASASDIFTSFISYEVPSKLLRSWCFLYFLCDFLRTDFSFLVFSANDFSFSSTATVSFFTSVFFSGFFSDFFSSEVEVVFVSVEVVVEFSDDFGGVVVFFLFFLLFFFLFLFFFFFFFFLSPSFSSNY